MRRIGLFRVATLWATVVFSGALYPQAPVVPEQTPPANPPQNNSSPKERPNPPSDPTHAPTPETPVRSEAPLQFTPPPLPPKPAVREPLKVQIDSRGKRVRTPREQTGRSRAEKDMKAGNALTATGTEQEFKIRSNVELVLLDVSVKDSQGGFVSGLAKENFKILDNKVPQDISVFQAQDVPVTVGLVVDNSGSVRPKKHEIVTAGLTFAKNSNPQDEVFVINFNDRVLSALPQGVDFTDDHGILRDALLVNPAQGRTALYDGLMTALDHIEKGRLDKKTIVLIADGGDNMSDTTREEIINRVRGSVVTIYTVGIYNPEDKDKDPGFLKELAEISGGEYYRPQNISHLVGVCEKIAHDIRNRYTLGYKPKNAIFDGKVRKLQVSALNSGDKRPLQVRTRSQYVAAPLESEAKSERD